MRYYIPLITLIGAGLLSGCSRKEETPLPAPLPAATVTTNQQAANASPRFGILTDRWQRPDGGYILEIRNVDPSGKMDAGYFNPRSINVAKAEASQAGQTIKVFIELRDVNYPGSTYDLTFDPKSDTLQGIYYQAALQQRFEVFFQRMK
jgi:hypothetical protein